MSVTMPPPLDRLVAAINAGDFEGFIALFAPDGIVDDWGRRFKGPAAIRKWSDKELIGAHGTLTVSQVIRKRGRIAFHGDWKSDFFTGPGHFVLVLDGERIREMRISET